MSTAWGIRVRGVHWSVGKKWREDGGGGRRKRERKREIHAHLSIALRERERERFTHTHLITGLIHAHIYLSIGLVVCLPLTELGVWGAETAFRGPPFFPYEKKEEGGSRDETFTFAVFGDMGTAEEDGSLDFGGEEVGG